MAKASVAPQAKQDLFDAQLAINQLEALFDNIKTHAYNAEDSKSDDLEAYTTAIEAIAEMGIRKCQSAARKITEARNGHKG